MSGDVFFASQAKDNSAQDMVSPPIIASSGYAHEKPALHKVCHHRYHFIHILRLRPVASNIACNPNTNPYINSYSISYIYTNTHINAFTDANCNANHDVNLNPGP